MNLVWRLAAGAIAIAALAGIVLYAEAQMDATGSFATTVWVLLRYFTITTNVLIALVFAALAAGVRVRPRLVGGTALCIALVGVIYDLLLHGLVDLTAGAEVANLLLHRVTPVAGVLYWLLATPKGLLRWTDPVLWAAYPVAYVAYALMRGAIDGVYAYPFIDLRLLGPLQVGVNVLVIGGGFLVAGWLMVGLDRLLAGRGRYG